jgi:hypothetical protein
MGAGAAAGVTAGWVVAVVAVPAGCAAVGALVPDCNTQLVPLSGKGGDAPCPANGTAGKHPEASAAEAASEITDLNRTDIPRFPPRPNSSK